MNFNQWLKQIIQCDEKGRLSSLINTSLYYVSRQEMYNRRIANNLMFDEDIYEEYNDYLRWHNNGDKR